MIHRLFGRPRRGGWRAGAIAALAYSGFVLPFGLGTGLFVWTPTTEGVLRTALIALFLPAIGEELVFRGPLLLAPKAWAAWLAGPLLLLFILWHPLNALVFTPAARALFFDWRFLIEAAALGAACTAATLAARSLWPAVALHWTAVVAWKALFGAPSFF